MHLLVLHNGNDFLFLVMEVLKTWGYMSMRAENLKEAREILEMERINLVIVENTPEREDGVRFHSFVREFSENPNIPFVFITEAESGNSQIMRSSYDYSMNTAAGAVAIIDVLEEIGLTRP